MMHNLSEKNVVLRSLSLNGQVRYELPAVFYGSINGYFVYDRPDPQIIHHLKNKVFKLDYPELVLVSMTENHCISCGFDSAGLLKNCYVNINLVPKEYENGHEWNDLELDIKVLRGYDNNLSPFVVDWDEFQQSSLTDELRLLTMQEVSKMLKRIIEKQFPFNLCEQKWFGIKKLS